MISNKKKTDKRALSFQKLEERQLMVGQVMASMGSGGTLQVAGSDSGEFIRVVQVGSEIRVSVQYNQPFARFNANQVRSLQVSMNGGNDKLEVNLPNKALDSFFVDMGRGAGEEAYLTFNTANSLNVRAIDSLHTDVQATGSVNRDAVFDFGNDMGDDELMIGRNSSINNLRVNMGGGADFVQLHSSRVGYANINMGSGDDRFTNAWNSQVSSGIIDGGPADKRNTWRGNKFGSGVTVRGF
jgi:hypothetical protein